MLLQHKKSQMYIAWTSQDKNQYPTKELMQQARFGFMEKTTKSSI